METLLLKQPLEIQSSAGVSGLRCVAALRTAGHVSFHVVFKHVRDIWPVDNNAWSLQSSIQILYRSISSYFCFWVFCKSFTLKILCRASKLMTSHSIQHLYSHFNPQSPTVVKHHISSVGLKLKFSKKGQPEISSIYWHKYEIQLLCDLNLNAYLKTLYLLIFNHITILIHEEFQNTLNIGCP